MRLNISDVPERLIELVQSVLDGNDITISQEGTPSQERTDSHRSSGWETPTELEPWLNGDLY